MTQGPGNAAGGRFAGQRVLITGGSSGIGAATAAAFAREGAVVGVCARRADRLAETVERCREHGGQVQSWVFDLADLDGIDAFAEQAAKDLGGGIDILVNNAGIPKRRRNTTLVPADLHEVMDTNFEAPVRLVRAVLPGMLERRSGHVVNLSSMGVHMFSYGAGLYAASKAAVELWTEALYLELTGTGVHAHLLVPGTTLTEFSRERDGNDAPFPVDPATAATPDQVADALLDCLGTDVFITYATARDRATAEAKNADPNGFLAGMRARLGG